MLIAHYQAVVKEARHLPASNACKHKAGVVARLLAGRRRWFESRPAADWLLGAAFLPMIILATAVGITAVVAPARTPANSEPAVAKAVGTPADADGYVEALARLGIERIPCQRQLLSIGRER